MSAAESVPYTCPRCETVTWAREGSASVRCRYCDHIWTPRLVKTLTSARIWLYAGLPPQSRRMQEKYPGDSELLALDTGDYLHTLKFQRTAEGCFA